MRVNANTDLALVLEVMEVRNALKGKRISITGHLGRPRKDIIAIIERAGGTFDSHPKYGTSFLVTNKDWNKGSTVTATKSNKLIEAENNGTKILSEEQFYELICQQTTD